MYRYRSAVLLLSFAVTLTACGGGGGSSDSASENTDLGALSCTGNRVWDGGESDVIEGALALVSETDGVTFENSRFPCAVFWEFSPTVNCSLAFTYEGFLSMFNQDDILESIGTSGANLVVTGTNGAELTFNPSNISLTQLDSLPDCILS